MIRGCWERFAPSRTRLLVDGQFVLRYEIDDGADGLPAGEGAFLACSFWLVANYFLQGRYADARLAFRSATFTLQ